MSTNCEHKNFKVQAKVTRLTESEDSKIVTGYHLDVEVFCTDCFKPFEFIGLPHGYSPGYPTINIEATECRMPIKPCH